MDVRLDKSPKTAVCLFLLEALLKTFQERKILFKGLSHPVEPNWCDNKKGQLAVITPYQFRGG